MPPAFNSVPLLLTPSLYRDTAPWLFPFGDNPNWFQMIVSTHFIEFRPQSS